MTRRAVFAALAVAACVVVTGCGTGNPRNGTGEATNSLIIKNNTHNSLRITLVEPAGADSVTNKPPTSIQARPYETLMLTNLSRLRRERKELTIAGTYTGQYGLGRGSCIPCIVDVGSKTYVIFCGSAVPQHTITIHFWTLH